jgi:hypothetical protein
MNLDSDSLPSRKSITPWLMYLSASRPNSTPCMYHSVACTIRKTSPNAAIAGRGWGAKREYRLNADIWMDV